MSWSVGPAAPLPLTKTASPHTPLWGFHPHAPGFSGATRPRTPRFTFGRPKVNRKTAKTKVLESFFCADVFKSGTCLFRITFCYLICGLVVVETSPAGLLKGYMFLGVLVETSFLLRTLGSIRRTRGQVEAMRGYPKGGGRPPLSRRGGGVHRGGTPSKGSLPYAPFWWLFRRGKSHSGYGGEAPEKLCAETQFL